MTGDLVIDLSVTPDSETHSNHLDCSHLGCPYRTDNTRRSKPNRTVGCINDTDVDGDYLALCPPACRLSAEKGKKWVNRVGYYQMKI